MRLRGLFLFCIGSFSAMYAPALEPDPALVLRSFLYTYPEKVQDLRRVDGDWTIRIGDTTFYWARGRLLPEELRDSWENYRSYNFTPYPQNIPAPEDFSPEQVEELRVQGSAEARQDRMDQHRAFQGALYGGMTRPEIERNLVRERFLGHPVTVHRDLAEPLGRAAEKIAAAAKEDRELADFIASIRSVDGYNWREIRGTRRMSYHSWGLAVDILCDRQQGQSAAQSRREGDLVVYWLWERVRNDAWMLVPPERRWMPPAAVIRAFEHEGFIWGGKWALYDNMHFEFRPELHEINRLLAGDSAETRIIKSEGLPDLHHLYPVNPLSGFGSTVFFPSGGSASPRGPGRRRGR
jgi:hypothetical protein